MIPINSIKNSFFDFLILTSVLTLLCCDVLSIKILDLNFKYAYLVILSAFFNEVYISYFDLIKCLKINKKLILQLVLYVSFLLGATFFIVDTSIGVIQLIFNLLSLFLAYSISSRLNLRLIYWSFLVSLFLLAFFGFIQFILINAFGLIVWEPQLHMGSFRINGLCWYPNFFNVFIFFFIPTVFLKKKWNKFDILVVALSLFIVIQSTAKAGWILLFFLIVYAFFLLDKCLVFSKLKVLIFVVLISWFVPIRKFTDSHLKNVKNFQVELSGQKIIRFSTDLNVYQPNSSRERLYIAQQGLWVFRDYWISGVGLRSYKSFITQMDKIKVMKYFTGKWVNRIFTHHENIWIEILSEQGLVGFLVVNYFLLKYLILYKVRNNYAACLKYSLVAYFYLSGQFVQNILVTIPYFIWGVLISVNSKPVSELEELN